MNKTEAKKKAQELIMEQIAKIGYGSDFDKYIAEGPDDAEEILKKQMDRVARMFGHEEAWFG